jgi:hypothetical protein
MGPRSKDEYEEVPDVEFGTLPEPTTVKNPRDTYPEADELQAKLLAYLDEVIKMPNPKIELPPVKVHQVENAPTSMADLIELIKTPTLTFVATSVAAPLLVIVLESEFFELIVPYLVCAAQFAATIPSLTNRFTKQSDRGFETLEEKETRLNALVDAVSFEVGMYIDKIQDLLDQVLKPIRPKLDKVSKAEAILKTFDKDIDIPDVSDIERELDGCTDEVQAKMEAVKGMIDFKKSIPLPFQSRQNFNKYAIYPVLAVFLVIQLVGVYTTVQQQNTAAAVDAKSIEQEVTRYFRGMQEVVADGVVEEFTVMPTADASEETFWFPLWIALQVYITADVQIFLGFLMTQAAVLAAVMNLAIKQVNDDAKRAVDMTGANEAFDKYLTTNTTKIRVKLLKLIQSLAKLDNLMAKAGLDKDFPTDMKGVKDTLGSMKDSLPTDLNGVDEKLSDFTGSLFGRR